MMSLPQNQWHFVQMLCDQKRELRPEMAHWYQPCPIPGGMLDVIGHMARKTPTPWEGHMYVSGNWAQLALHVQETDRNLDWVVTLMFHCPPMLVTCLMSRLELRAHNALFSSVNATRAEDQDQDRAHAEHGPWHQNRRAQKRSVTMMFHNQNVLSSTHNIISKDMFRPRCWWFPSELVMIVPRRTVKSSLHVQLPACEYGSDFEDYVHKALQGQLPELFLATFIPPRAIIHLIWLEFAIRRNMPHEIVRHLLLFV